MDDWEKAEEINENHRIKRGGLRATAWHDDGVIRSEFSESSIIHYAFGSYEPESIDREFSPCVSFHTVIRSVEYPIDYFSRHVTVHLYMMDRGSHPGLFLVRHRRDMLIAHGAKEAQKENANGGLLLRKLVRGDFGLPDTISPVQEISCV